MVIDQRKGMTMIEVMVAAVLIVVAVLGAMGFRYLTALDAKKADIQISAGRVGLLLIEGWKAKDGDLNYDPVSEFNSAGIIIVQNGSGGPSSPTGFSLKPTPHFEIQENDMYFYTTLSYKDDPNLPRIINARVGWLQGAGQGSGSGANQYITISNFVIP